MYCTNCGKQIIDTARFCNYCGSPVAGANFTQPVTPSAPVSAPVESGSVSAPVFEDIQSDNSFEEKEINSENVLSSDYFGSDEQTPSIDPGSADNISDNGNQSENARSTAYGEASEAQMPPVSEPNTEAPSVPDIGSGNVYSLPAPNQIPMSGEGGVNAAQVPEKPAKPLPERKYTLGHIMMCLGAVAVMAIVAGVFAGLYFSVV